LIPAGGARWADAVAHHARVLGDHYRHTRDRRDIDEAIDCGREALRHTPPDSERLAARLDAFGLHLSFRHDAGGAPADPDAATPPTWRAPSATWATPSTTSASTSPEQPALTRQVGPPNRPRCARRSPPTGKP